MPGLSKRRGRRKPGGRVRCDATLDVECSAWDRFACAAVHARGGTEVFHDVPELVDHLLTLQGATIWAHCGGVFDFLVIAEELRRREIPCAIDLAGSRISRITGGGITLRDSWPLVPMALDKAAGLAGVAAPVLGLACVCGKRCGGYCAIRPGDRRAEVAAYCAADATTLAAVMRAVIGHAEDLGLSLRGTLGSTAWASARDQLMLPDADIKPADWRAIREAYFGGRVTIARPRASGPGAHWDLSSAYPAALASTSLPWGDPATYGGREAGACLANDRPGVYACRVRVPADLYLPPLPVRQGTRTTFPTGTFHGTWTLPELRAAERRGVAIESVRWAIVWASERVVFGELIGAWYGARHRAGKGTALGEWIRLLANSLTGKFAEAPERASARMFPTEIKTCKGTRPCSPRACVGACGAMEQLDLWGVLWGCPYYRMAPSGHLQWGAYLTAVTRGTWLDAADSHGEDLVYGDTDSIWSTAPASPAPAGDGLGQWQHKNAWESWECRAPRAYRYRDPEGGVVVRTSGMSLTDEEWEAGGAELDRGVMSFAEAARASGSLFRRVTRRYTLPNGGRASGVYGDRVLDAASGMTFPLPYGKKTVQGT